MYKPYKWTAYNAWGPKLSRPPGGAKAGPADKVDPILYSCLFAQGEILDY